MRSNPSVGTELHYDDEVMIQWGFTEVRGRVAEVYGPQALPTPLTVDAETDELITHGAHLLDMTREAFVAEAMHQMAAAHGSEVEQALQAAGDGRAPNSGRAHEGSI